MTNGHEIGDAGIDSLAREDLYPIREVSRLTGVNPVTLRAWERRYGLLQPHRTDSGHRLYSMADIERVRSILGWIDRGVAVSKVVSIIDRQVMPRTAPASPAPQPSAPVGEALDDWQVRLLDALNQYDLNRLEQLYGQLCQLYPLAQLAAELWLPLLRQLQPHQGGRSATRLMFESFLQSRLQRSACRTDSAQPLILLIMPEGQPLPVAGWLAAALLADAGYNLIFLDGMPEYPQLLDIAGRSSCHALLLYSDRVLDAELLQRTLPRAGLALECPMGLLGDACELQPQQLSPLPLACLGALGAQLPARVESLLAGMLPS